jgi:hypothetical protein
MADDKKPSGIAAYSGWGFGLAVGIAIGVSLGIAMSNIAVGIAVGIGIGIVFGLAFTRSKNVEDARAGSDNEPDESS